MTVVNFSDYVKSTPKIAVGNRVKIVQVDKKGWCTIYHGTVNWIDESEFNNTGMATVRIDYHRAEHVDYPERGADLPVTQKELAFDLGCLELI